jgi:hypothetical protein
MASKFVGLPDKLDIRPSDCLPMPSQIHDIPPDTKVLGADATPDLARLMLLSKLLIYIIF